MARVQEEESRFADPNDVMSQAKEYIYVKKQMEYLTAKQKELREQLFAKIDELGEIDSKGSINLFLDAAIEGIVTLQKQRKVSRKINEEVADQIIVENGLQDKLYKTVVVVDEDAVMAALYSDELTEDEIDRMFPETVTWALQTLKK